ncbi:hypothetical protein AB0F15_45020 [Amycolatopsis sp. NPDC026612]
MPAETMTMPTVDAIRFPRETAVVGAYGSSPPIGRDDGAKTAGSDGCAR